MAIKRDYGSFSRAATKLLAPMVTEFGFKHVSGTSFARTREGWNESFFLQQSGYGSGDFCVNIGISVPGICDFWQDESMSSGLFIGWRLSDRATEDSGDCWYHAKDKSQLTSSLERVYINLKRALPWFDQFQSLHDVVEGFRSRSGRSTRSEDYAIDEYPTFAMNYGFLLALSGDLSAAREWLRVALARAKIQRYWDPVNRVFLIQPMPGTKPFRQTVEDRKMISTIEAALSRLE